MNKEAAANVLSLLLQTGFSGRAEIGLIGDDDLLFKVSPDGATWYDGIRVDKDTGAVSFPSSSPGGIRERLTAARTYYVNASSGSDSNDGLTAGTAFQTIQKAIDTAAALDSSIYDVTIQLAAGTFAASAGLVCKTMAGAGSVTIVGDETTPSNVVIQVTGSGTKYGLYSSGNTIYNLRGVQLTYTGGGTGFGIFATAGANVQFQNVDFGAGWLQHIRSENYAIIRATGNYSISGGAASHWEGSTGLIYVGGKTVTLTGTPAFSSAFAEASFNSTFIAGSMTFTGSATGKRYSAATNSVIYVGGAGATYLPGDVAGSTSTGGQYA